MLLIKTNTTFFKKNKKTKHGKKYYKKKYYYGKLFVNDILIGTITKISITRGASKPIEKPVFDENTPGWNQGLQDIFKKYQPIPINVEENVPQPKTLILPKGFGLSLSKDEPSCLNFILTKYAEHKLANNEVEEDNKEDLINMISEFNQKVTKHKIKKLLTDIIISLDWDDVMYHLMQKNIEFVEKEYGVKNVHNEITDYYYLYRTYPKIADELWNHPENYISGELVDGAKEFYQELVKLVGEDKIQIVTSSMENVIPLKDKMIREKFNINCKIVHSIFGKHKKYEFTKDTLLIDDFVGNVREHFIHNMNYGIVFNHMNLEYIKQECDQEGYLHVTTFEEVLEKVKIYLELLNNKS